MNDKLILFFGIFILSLKLIFIDMDPPEWQGGLYQPIDEPYYSSLAYNYYETGSLFISENPVLVGHPPLTNLVTYLSLLVFGDNYLGLRFSSFIFSTLSFILFFLLLKKVSKSIKLRLATVLFLVLNFTFTTASFIVEPSIARMFTAILVLFLIVRWQEKKNFRSLDIIWQATTVGFLFFFSYSTNVFLVLGAYITLVLIKSPSSVGVLPLKNFKILARQTIYFMTGVGISLLAYFLLIHFLNGKFFQELFVVGSSYGGRVAFSLKELVFNLVDFILANYFRFNPFFLVMVILSIVAILAKSEIKYNRTILLTGIFLISFAMQSAFINDFPQRKLIVLFPFLLLLAAYGLELGWKEIFFKNTRTSLVWLSFCIPPLLLLVYLERQFFSNYLLPLISTIGGILMLMLFMKKISYRKIAPCFLFFLLILPEVIYVVDHYFIKQPYHYKKAFKDLSEYDGYNFIGGFSMGFRVYNDIRPEHNIYLYRNQPDLFWKRADSLSNNGLKDYSIGTANDQDNFEKIGFKPVKVLLPATQTVANQNWVLYEETELK